MRCLVLLAALPFFAARTAGAQPSVAADAAAPAAPDLYVAATLTSGVDSAVDWIYAGGQVESGYRFGTSWWLHASVGEIGRAGWGTTSDLTLQRPVEYSLEARLGPELRRCWSAGTCWYAGLDAGYRSGTARGDDISGLMFAGRGGLDLGAGRLHVRPGVELVASTEPHIERDVPFPEPGIGVTVAAAYAW